MANRYWVGGTGNWHSAANWSTSSGGAGGAGIPTSSDDVYIDGFGSNVISLGSSAGFCQNMTWSNYYTSINSTNSLGGLRCYGTWHQANNPFGPPFYGSLTGTGFLGFVGGSAGVPVTLGDVVSDWPISVQGFYTTSSTFSTSSSISLGVSSASGNSFFDSSAISLTAAAYFFNAGTINVGDMYLTGYTTSGTVLTVNASVGLWKPVITHTGSFYTAQAGGRTASLDFYLGSASNQKININSDILVGYGIKIYAQNGVTSQLGTLNISVSGEPIIFEAGKTHVINTFIMPSGSFPNSFSSTSPGTQYTLQSGTAGQTLSFSNLGVQDSVATGATYWNAFTSNGCVNNGNNTNWYFSPARFWVGGSGTWDSTAGTKWSTTSGGVGGASVPTSSDDVIFNGLSAPSGVVTVDTSATRYCKSLTFSNFDGTFSASAPGGAPMEISGNLTFSINPAMVFNYDGGFKFTPNATTATITGDSKLIGNNNLEIAATGGGTVTVSDQCAFNNVVLSQGTFKIGSGIIVFVSTFTATGLYPTTINSTTPGVKGRLYKGSGTVTVNNVSIQDSDAFGGATWNAVNSTNLGNNSGWIFSPTSGNAFMQFF